MLVVRPMAALVTIMLRTQNLSYMISHWCRPQWGFASNAVQEVLSNTWFLITYFQDYLERTWGVLAKSLNSLCRNNLFQLFIVKSSDYGREQTVRDWKWKSYSYSCPNWKFGTLLILPAKECCIYCALDFTFWVQKERLMIRSTLCISYFSPSVGANFKYAWIEEKHL